MPPSPPPAPDRQRPLRVLQLSDPHLLADPLGTCRDRVSLALLRHGLRTCLARMAGAGGPPDLLLLTGDLCQDESWGGYARLRDLLTEPAFQPLPLALLPGNHDHPLLLRAVLGRRAAIAPVGLALGPWQLLLLDSHQPGQTAGVLGDPQLRWLERRLSAGRGPVLVAVHHPPVPIGDPGMDAIGLRDGPILMDLLARSGRVRAVVFGHVHQHWRGMLPGGAGIPLLACPSCLSAFPAVQPCPLGREGDPGGRVMELTPAGAFEERLLRWSPPDPPTLEG